jgi:hypothetical protein
LTDFDSLKIKTVLEEEVLIVLQQSLYLLLQSCDFHGTTIFGYSSNKGFKYFF